MGDDENEYRHVILPKELGKLVPRARLMSEDEWRMIGVQQSVGWRHYMIHRPEPHILLFKRAKPPAAAGPLSQEDILEWLKRRTKILFFLTRGVKVGFCDLISRDFLLRTKQLF